MKRVMSGLLAAGLLIVTAVPTAAQDYNGSINGSLAFRGETEAFNVAVVTINASGDPTDAKGRYQYRVTYRDDTGAISTYNGQGRVTCFARIGNRAYVEVRLTKVIGEGLEVGDYIIEGWEDNSATGETDGYTFGGVSFPSPGHCTDSIVIDHLDSALDGLPADFVRHGNITIR